MCHKNEGRKPCANLSLASRPLTRLSLAIKKPASSLLCQISLPSRNRPLVTWIIWLGLKTSQGEKRPKGLMAPPVSWRTPSLFSTPQASLSIILIMLHFCFILHRESWFNHRVKKLSTQFAMNLKMLHYVNSVSGNLQKTCAILQFSMFRTFVTTWYQSSLWCKSLERGKFAYGN